MKKILLFIDISICLISLFLLIRENKKAAFGMAAMESAGKWFIYLIGLVIAVIILIVILVIPVIQSRK